MNMPDTEKFERLYDELQQKCEDVLMNIGEIREHSRERSRLLRDGLKEIMELEEYEDSLEGGENL